MLTRTGVAATSEFARAVVLVLRLVRSCLTRAGTPPRARESKAAFLATICVRASSMIGLMTLTAAITEVASLSETGFGVTACLEHIMNSV